MISIFVYELKNNKYFVYYTYNKEINSKTNEILNKFEFVRNNTVIKIIEEIYDCTIYDVDKIVKIYMNKYGIHNVKGGSYIQEINKETESYLNKELEFVNKQEKKNTELSKLLENNNNIPILKNKKNPVIVLNHVYYICCNICNNNCIGRGGYTEYNTIVTNPSYHKDLICCPLCSDKIMGYTLVDNDCKQYVVRGFMQHNES